VLYCVDTAVTGFKWSERGKASVSKFSAERFTVKVVSDTARSWLRSKKIRKQKHRGVGYSL
jgi:hypothetical protein